MNRTKPAYSRAKKAQTRREAKFTLVLIVIALVVVINLVAWLVGSAQRRNAAHLESLAPAAATHYYAHCYEQYCTVEEASYGQ